MITREFSEGATTFISFQANGSPDLTTAYVEVRARREYDGITVIARTTNLTADGRGQFRITPFAESVLSPTGTDVYHDLHVFVNDNGYRERFRCWTDDGRDFGAHMFCGDYLPLLRDYFAGSARFGGASDDEHFVLFDPPYLGLQYYKQVFSAADHRKLCRLLLSLPCPAAICGYQSDVYDEELSTAIDRGQVRTISMETVCRSGESRTEILWMNFPPPATYHDTRFAGIDRRERERIKRRIRNWSRGLARMPTIERQAIFEACQAAADTINLAAEVHAAPGQYCPTCGYTHCTDDYGHDFRPGDVCGSHCRKFPNRFAGV